MAKSQKDRAACTDLQTKMSINDIAVYIDHAYCQMLPPACVNEERVCGGEDPADSKNQCNGSNVQHSDNLTQGKFCAGESWLPGIVKSSADTANQHVHLPESSQQSTTVKDSVSAIQSTVKSSTFFPVASCEAQEGDNNPEVLESGTLKTQPAKAIDSCNTVSGLAVTHSVGMVNSTLDDNACSNIGSVSLIPETAGSSTICKTPKASKSGRTGKSKRRSEGSKKNCTLSKKKKLGNETSAVLDSSLLIPGTSKSSTVSVDNCMLEEKCVQCPEILGDGVGKPPQLCMNKKKSKKVVTKVQRKSSKQKQVKSTGKSKARKTKKVSVSPRKQKQKKEDTPPGGSSISDFTVCSVIAAQGDPWGQAVPHDILLQIFRVAVEALGAIPFLPRAAQVCRRWHGTSQCTSLWKHVDLSRGSTRKLKKTLHHLLTHRLENVRMLDLRYWEALGDADIKLVCLHCPELRDLRLSHCSKVNGNSLKLLAEKCTNLEQVEFSSMSTYFMSSRALCHFVSKAGPKLEKLGFAYNILVKFDPVLKEIMEYCPNLQVLDLSNCLFSTFFLVFTIERLQVSCPRLKSLLFANSLFRIKSTPVPEQLESPGFCSLQTLNIARSPVSRITKFAYMNDSVLRRFLKNASRLKSLDVSGCRHITNAGLQSLDVYGLQWLDVAHCYALVADVQGIKQTIYKWKSSLEGVNISGNSMNEDILRTILQCEKLTQLDLTGCRGLPHQMRKFYSQSSLQELEAFISNQE